VGRAGKLKGLDAEGNPEGVTPEDGDDWSPADYAS
jgi:hypothetical protein